MQGTPLGAAGSWEPPLAVTVSSFLSLFVASVQVSSVDFDIDRASEVVKGGILGGVQRVQGRFVGECWRTSLSKIWRRQAASSAAYCSC